MHGSRFPPGRLALHSAAGHAEGIRQDSPRGDGKSIQGPGFQKNYFKLVGEEPTPVMPEEMERLVKGLPRDPEIVALFKKINDAGPVPLR